MFGRAAIRLGIGAHSSLRQQCFGYTLLHLQVRHCYTVLYRLHTYGRKLLKLESGPMPNVMVALPNTGGALCSTPQSLADAHY